MRVAAHPTDTGGRVHRRRLRRAVLVAAAVVAVLAVPAGAAPRARTIRVGGSPDRVVVGPGAAWVGDDGHLERVDAASDAVAAVPGLAGPIAVDATAVWVRDLATVDRVARLDPATRQVQASVALPGAPAAIAIGAGAVWVLDSTATVTRIDPATNRVTATVALGSLGFAITATPDAVWASGRAANDAEADLWRLDPTTGSVVATVRTEQNCGHLASGAGAVWVECVTAERVDPSGALHDSGAAAQNGLAIADGAVDTLGLDGTITRLDPASGQTLGHLHVRYASEGLGAGDGVVWATDPHVTTGFTTRGSGTVTRLDVTRR